MLGYIMLGYIMLGYIMLGYVIPQVDHDGLRSG